jgi:hypothetical protein
VVLCLPSALKVEDVHLRMTGQSKIGYVDIHKPLIYTTRLTQTGIGGVTQQFTDLQSVPTVVWKKSRRFSITDGLRS